MEYTIAICDDSDADRQVIGAMVRRWAEASGCGVRIDEFPSAESFLFEYAEKKDYDILLLDIEMGAMDGVTMAKRLRGENDTVQIVFVTGYSDYISDGYDVAALHYLMKPVREEKLRSVLDRAAEKLAKNEKVLNLELGGEMVRVPVYQIRYAEVFGNYVTVHALHDYTVIRAPGQGDGGSVAEPYLRPGNAADLHQIDEHGTPYPVKTLVQLFLQPAQGRV